MLRAVHCVVTGNIAQLKALAGTREYKAAVIEEAQRLHTDGMSFEAIAREWNEKGLHTISGKGRRLGRTIGGLVYG